MNRKAVTVGLLVVSAAALVFIATADLGENLVYYWTPTEMIGHGDKAYGASIRLGGLVEPGSIVSEGNDLRFRVTDGTATVAVASRGVPPQMFREGIGVVLEGTYTPEGTFTCNRMMVKHDNEYRAPSESGGKPELDTLQEG